MNKSTFALFAAATLIAACSAQPSADTEVMVDDGAAMEGDHMMDDGTVMDHEAMEADEAMVDGEAEMEGGVRVMQEEEVE